MRYQVFNEKSVTKPVFTAPWCWVASLYANTVAFRFDKCRLVDSKSGETLLDWARGCVVGNSKGKQMPEMATLMTGFRMTRERELQQVMLIARQLHDKGHAPAFALTANESDFTHTFTMGTTGKGMSFPMSEQGKHYFANDSWHPVVLDPMGEQTPEYCKQWCEEQQQEKQALIAAGEPVNY
jgi:hypothetical protein